MSDSDFLLVQSVFRLFSDKCTVRELAEAERGAGREVLWSAVSDFGLTTSLVDEGRGGFGIPPAKAFDVIRLCGQFALPLPLPETMLANRLLSLVGLPLHTAPATFIAEPDLELSRAQSGWRLSGTAQRVPWGRTAHIVAIAEHGEQSFVANVGRLGVQVTAGENIAKEPRDALSIEAELDAEAVAPIGDRTRVSEVRAWGAAMRCSQIAGALERIAEMTVAYAQERSQFGRPIGKFQAIQQNIAVLAQQTAAARAAADLAALAFAKEPLAVQAIAAAKVRVGEAAGIAASIAHQVHGAMGFAQEYGLHYFTRRLWSWREEFGNETVWSSLLGKQFTKTGADRLWAEITAV